MVLEVTQVNEQWTNDCKGEIIYTIEDRSSKSKVSGHILKVIKDINYFMITFDGCPGSRYIWVIKSARYCEPGNQTMQRYTPIHCPEYNFTFPKNVTSAQLIFPSITKASISPVITLSEKLDQIIKGDTIKERNNSMRTVVTLRSLDNVTLESNVNVMLTFVETSSMTRIEKFVVLKEDRKFEDIFLPTVLSNIILVIDIISNQKIPFSILVDSLIHDTHETSDIKIQKHDSQSTEHPEFRPTGSWINYTLFRNMNSSWQTAAKTCEIENKILLRATSTKHIFVLMDIYRYLYTQKGDLYNSGGLVLIDLHQVGACLNSI